jgi:CheY-like chemotaxis protein
MSNPSSLLRVFAHELRNSLSPLRSSVQLLRLRNGGNEALQAALQTMDKSLDNTLATIERFVDADHVMAGSVDLAPEGLELKAIVDRAVERARPHTDARNAQVAMTLPAQGLRVAADADRTCQVVAQLIANASLASPRGATIEISAQQRVDAIELVVRDAEGATLADPADTLASFRAPTERGLGLRIARRLMELQAGALDSTTDPASGRTAFVVRLPHATLAAASAPAIAPESKTGSNREAVSVAPSTERAGTSASTAVPRPVYSRILVVDDNTAVRNAYRDALEEMGYNVMLAANGEEALRVADESAPQVALIDIHLPTLNGYQVARELRSRHPGRPIKLVMLSGMALDEHMVRLSKTAGFDDCIDKGAGPQALDELLRAS